MISKKHYIMVAQVIAPKIRQILLNERTPLAVKKETTQMISQLADRFHADNPNFSHMKFYLALGICIVCNQTNFGNHYCKCKIKRT